MSPWGSLGRALLGVLGWGVLSAPLLAPVCVPCGEYMMPYEGHLPLHGEHMSTHGEHPWPLGAPIAHGGHRCSRENMWPHGEDLLSHGEHPSPHGKHLSPYREHPWPLESTHNPWRAPLLYREHVWPHGKDPSPHGEHPCPMKSTHHPMESTYHATESRGGPVETPTAWTS